MPTYLAKSNKKKTYIKKYAKRYGAKKPQMVTFKKRDIIPRFMHLRLPYVSPPIDATCTSGVHALYEFNYNSIFDPNQTGAGHQPMGRDQWAGLYTRYLVTGLSYDISAWNVTSVAPFRIAIGASDGTGVPADLQTAVEDPNYKSKLGGNDYKVMRMTGYISAPQAMGITKERYKSDLDYSGIMGANPNNLGELGIFFQPFGGSITTLIRFVIKLKYYCTFSQPVTLVQS